MTTRFNTRGVSAFGAAESLSSRRPLWSFVSAAAIVGENRDGWRPKWRKRRTKHSAYRFEVQLVVSVNLQMHRFFADRRIANLEKRLRQRMTRFRGRAAGATETQQGQQEVTAVTHGDGLFERVEGIEEDLRRGEDAACEKYSGSAQTHRRANVERPADERDRRT
jgi:hypothetical protein